MIFPSPLESIAHKYKKEKKKLFACFRGPPTLGPEGRVTTTRPAVLSNLLVTADIGNGSLFVILSSFI